MVRSIVKDTSFTMENGDVYNLRAGDRVAMYPPALHKHPEIFENPSVSCFILALYMVSWCFTLPFLTAIIKALS